MFSCNGYSLDHTLFTLTLPTRRSLSIAVHRKYLSFCGIISAFQSHCLPMGVMRIEEGWMFWRLHFCCYWQTVRCTFIKGVLAYRSLTFAFNWMRWRVATFHCHRRTIEHGSRIYFQRRLPHLKIEWEEATFVGLFTHPIPSFIASGNYSLDTLCLLRLFDRWNNSLWLLLSICP